MDSVIYPVDSVIYPVDSVIYPVDSVIQPSNHPGPDVNDSSRVGPGVGGGVRVLAYKRRKHNSAL